MGANGRADKATPPPGDVPGGAAFIELAKGGNQKGVVPSSTA